MKRFLNNLTPILILWSYCIIAGGSVNEILITILIILILPIIIAITIAIYDAVDKKKNREKGLTKAKEQFGDYTQGIEYDFGKYILYDEPTHRILLKDSILDSTKLANLKITERAPRTSETYNEKQVTTTSTGSAIGRGVAGALIAGPVGAIIGGATAKKTTETTKTYDIIPGLYTIEVIDVNGNSRTKFSTHNEKYHYATKSFLQNIIDENTKYQRLVLQQAQEENLQKILGADSNRLILGGNAEAIQDLLINSSVMERASDDQYILSKDAIGVVNCGWDSSFDTIQIIIRDHIITKMNAVSSAFTASTFKDMLLEMSVLAKRIGESYGEPKLVSNNISYTSLTEDNNCINAYLWEKDDCEGQKIDILCENGKFKYQFIAEKK